MTGKTYLLGSEQEEDDAMVDDCDIFVVDARFWFSWEPGNHSTDAYDFASKMEQALEQIMGFEKDYDSAFDEPRFRGDDDNLANAGEMNIDWMDLTVLSRKPGSWYRSQMLVDGEGSFKIDVRAHSQDEAIALLDQALGQYASGNCGNCQAGLIT